MYWRTDTSNTCEGGTYIYPYSRYVREMEISLLLGDAGVETLTCNTAASVCVWNPYPKWLHSYSLNLQGLLFSTFSADIFLIVCMTPSMGWTQVDELAPYVRLIIYRDTAILLLCSSILPEFWCKMWILVQNEFSSLTVIMFKLFPLLTNSTIFFSRDLGTHKTILFHKFEMHTQGNLFHW